MTSDASMPVRNPDLLRAALTAGLTWLYDTEQPADATVTHHGQICFLPDRLAVGFAPLPNPIVIIDIRDARYDDSKFERKLLNPLTAEECADAAALLGDLGRSVIDRWNGAGCETGSFRLAGPIHPTLIAANQRYHAGCPDHPSELVFCQCERFRAGFAMAVKPTWPELTTSVNRPTATSGGAE